MIFEDELSKSITEGKFYDVYFIFGEDAYLKNYYSNKLIDKSYDGDPFFNLQKFEDNVDLQEVYDAVNQFPMMSDKKCVVLSDFDFEGELAPEQQQAFNTNIRKVIFILNDFQDMLRSDLDWYKAFTNPDEKLQQRVQERLEMEY